MSRFCSVFIALGVMVAQAQALFVSLGGAVPSTPFELSYTPTQFPIHIILQVHNTSTGAVSVLAWQLDLRLEPMTAASGSLLFAGVNSPPNPLYGTQPNPQSIPELPPPSSTVLVSDADQTDPFVGEQVMPNVPRNVVDLTLAVDPAATGTFQLMMRDFDSNTSEGSAWIDAEDQSGTPIPFENDAPAFLRNYISIGTINVHKQGDYDRNGTLDEADFRTWRASFGETIAASHGADGDGNGIIDAADYVVWRAQLRNLLPPTPSLSNLPEAKSFSLGIEGLIALALGSHISLRTIHLKQHFR